MIYLDKESQRPIYLQLYESIRTDILNGTFSSGEKLPPSRHLATEFSISRNTVNSAYAQLLAEGFIESHRGSGHRVCAIDLDILPKDMLSEKRTPGPKKAQLLENENPANHPNVKAAFEYGPIDNAIFPIRQWRKSLGVAMDQIDADKTRFYPKRPGTLVLQNALAQHLEKTRGIHCDPEQIVITCGIQHSMEILANLFSDSEKRFAVEEPGYDGTRKIFENRQFSILPVPVERDGICVNGLENLSADLLFLTPSHQFPTGTILPFAKRLRLLDWAAKSGCLIIEDDYVNELRYQTAPLPSLFSLDTSGCVIYAGTFAKSLAPDLRVAYLILPPKLLPVYQDYYWRYNGQVSALIQYALADFISSGEYGKQIHRLRTYYKQKHHTLCQAIESVFGDKAAIQGKGAGLHILLRVNTPLTSLEMVRTAREAGIIVYPIAQHYVRNAEAPSSTVLLGLSYTPADQYEKHMKTLYAQWIRA